MSSSRYADLSREELIRLLERRDARRALGLVWERERISRDNAENEDFVALDLDVALSTPTEADEGWRNLIIEGDNWDALRVLRLTHAGGVKCILIDVPYNTGNKDFVYNDRFVGKEDRYRQSLWIEFLYRRLLLARDLLSDDGVILVCINDENRALLDLLMQQVFPGMRLGSFVWRTKDTNNSDKRRNWSGVHEHILVFANPGFSFIGPDAGPGKFKLKPDLGERYAHLVGVPVRLDPLTKAGTLTSRPHTYYPIQDPETELWYPCAPNRVWAHWSEIEVQRQKDEAKAEPIDPKTGKARKIAKPGTGPSIESYIRANDIFFPPEEEPPFFFASRQELDDAIERGDVPRDGKKRPLLRKGLPRLDFWVGKKIARGRPTRIVKKTEDDDSARKPVGSWIGGLKEDVLNEDVEMLRSDRQGVGTAEIEHLFGEQVFSFPKPFSLIRALVQVTTQEGDVVLDFFAGSGTTGHAVLSLNEEDDGERSFILVSNTETTPEAPDKNLCRDVCAARLRKVIAGHGDADPLPGNFAYLRTRRLDWDDAPYDLTNEQIWLLLQLRHQRPLCPFDPAAPLQASPPSADEPDVGYLVLITDWTAAAEAELQRLLALGPAQAFSPAPGAVRASLNLPHLSIEAAPGRLMDEFPRVIAGL